MKRGGKERKVEEGMGRKRMGWNSGWDEREEH